MGTDIHAFLEYKSQSISPIYSCAAGFYLSRDYPLFNVLGNGRNYHFPQHEWTDRAVIEPKGVPNDISLIAARELYDLVLGSSQPQQPEYPDHWFWGKEQCITVLEAEQRVRELSAFWGTVTQTFNLNCTSHTAVWKTVSKISLHSASYLTYDELLMTVEACTRYQYQLPSDYLALLSYFKTFIEMHDNENTRVLFWFDN